MDVVSVGVGIVPVAAKSFVEAAVVRVVARAIVAVEVDADANVAAHGPPKPQVTGHMTSLTLLSSEQNSFETQEQSSLVSTQSLGCGAVAMTPFMIDFVDALMMVGVVLVCVRSRRC